MITFENVNKQFDGTAVVKNISMTFADGDISVIIGPSGCGKTTTMKMINRLIDPDNGKISINGQPVKEYNAVSLRRNIGYVIQETGLFPHYTVFENIAVVPRLLKWDKNRTKKRVFELLDLVTLDASYADQYPAQLSGGERQRVGLARSLAADPEILLMDEPFGAIDPINRLILQDVLLEIQETIQKTIVFVTHDINEAIKLGSRIAIMNNGELVQYDTPENIIFNPENDFVEAMLGHDRTMKALTLKMVKEFTLHEGFCPVPVDISDNDVTSIFNKDKSAVILCIDENEKLAGRIYREKKKDGSFRIIHDNQPISVERTANLNKTLSVMLESGERTLPIVNSKKKFTGIVKLGQLFDEIGGMQENE